MQKQQQPLPTPMQRLQSTSVLCRWGLLQLHLSQLWGCPTAAATAQQCTVLPALLQSQALLRHASLALGMQKQQLWAAHWGLAMACSMAAMWQQMAAQGTLP